VTRALGNGVSASINLESTYDWNGAGWTIPLNAGILKVTWFGPQLVSLFAGARVSTETPAGGPDWGLRSRSRCCSRADAPE
jgi:hypothetical protein